MWCVHQLSILFHLVSQDARHWILLVTSHQDGREKSVYSNNAWGIAQRELAAGGQEQDRQLGQGRRQETIEVVLPVTFECSTYTLVLLVSTPGAFTLGLHMVFSRPVRCIYTSTWLIIKALLSQTFIGWLMSTRTLCPWEPWAADVWCRWPLNYILEE